MKLTDIDTIRELTARHGFRLSKSKGQNFLTAAWVPESIADAAELDAETGVLEVGPGVGCLTRELSIRSGRVLSVELDRSLKPILDETLVDCKNVELVYGDALKLDLRSLCEKRLGAGRKAVCANLPYNVTSPLLTALIEAGCFDTITVMIQREVARRICADPDTADYGAFTVFVQWYMQAEILFDVPPSCFVPQPKVTSSVIRLRRRPSPPAEVLDERLFFRLVRAAFNQRRKTLVNAVSSAMPELGKERAAEAVAKCGFDTKIRGESLDIVAFVKIANEILSLMTMDL